MLGFQGSGKLSSVPNVKAHTGIKKKEQIKELAKNNRDKNKKACKKYYLKNKDSAKKRVSKWVRLNPWSRSHWAARDRCLNKKNASYKSYGGRGIKHELSRLDVKRLWLRDSAELMVAPTIDRIDNEGDYSFNNCRFMERTENSKHTRTGRNYHDENKKRIHEENIRKGRSA